MVVSYVIVCNIELQWYLPFESVKAEEINNLISSTFSALASGLLIYFLTSWLPVRLEYRKVKSSLDDGIENVNVLLANIIPGYSPITIEKRKEVIDIDKSVERMSRVNWDDKSEGSEARIILENFRFLKTHILNYLLVFQRHLTQKQIEMLYRISNSSLEQLITPNICPRGDVRQQIIDGYKEILENNRELQESAGYTSKREVIPIAG